LEKFFYFGVLGFEDCIGTVSLSLFVTEFIKGEHLRERAKKWRILDLGYNSVENNIFIEITIDLT
jgi:hypothetical protein